ncbi:hypothetical protein PG994_000597 [Apiospora phragmitis]|uniref:FAD dependent oxidoreductase domain-containing protein n=1 Tax=Apiospora phragmitis TaxID=2905665 RepID=A0ABR1X6R4_9PEZI
MGSVTQEAQLLRDVKSVAVIGAGISGVASAAHLLRYGLDVTVLEQSSIAGGVWHYDPRTANEPTYPNEHPPIPYESDPSKALGGKSTPEETSFEEVSLVHAPPGPCYVGLRNNVPTSLMRSTLLDWPEGTEDFVSQNHLEKYVQRLAEHTGAQDKTLYDTSVESVYKVPGSPQWTVDARTLIRIGLGDESEFKFVDRTWQFDTVVVASGHYHEPRVPNIPGLLDLKQRFPDRVMHSKRYRTPEIFRDKTVFILGAGVSSLDIARESEGTARHIYQSSRGGKFDLPPSLLPSSAQRVAGIQAFVALEEETPGTLSSPEESPIPFEVVLDDGTRLRDVDRVVLGTGYISSYPFLGPRLQAPGVPLAEADGRVVITADGAVTHNLHKDVFYLADPTLAFVGVPYHVSTFSLFDFQAEVVARVFAGRATLPTEAAMRREYDQRRGGENIRGEGSSGSKEFHSLWGRETEYIDELLGWVNRDAALLGCEAMKGVDDRWRGKRAEFAKKMKEIRRWPPVAAEEDHADGGGYESLTVKPAEFTRTSVGKRIGASFYDFGIV